MRILFIKRGAIGDVLMTTPLVRQIKQLYPEAQLDYCVSKSCQVVLRDNIYIRSVIALDDSDFSIKGLFKFIKFVYSIKKQYDYVFILGKSWLVNLVFKVIQSKLIGFSREKISMYLLDKYVLYNDVTKYQVLYYLDLLSISGLGMANYNNVAMDLVIPDTDKKIVKDLLNSLAIKQFVVVTNSGGNNAFEHNGIRMLPQNKIMALLKHLLQTNTVILLGSGVDIDNYNQYVKTLNTTIGLINLAGKLKISQSTYLLSLAQHFYVTDCGAMHLGFIAGIDSKMTCFFGPTNPQHIVPANTKCKVIWDDADIFNEKYQLYGNIGGVGTKYFQRLEINEVV
ncbi:MAG: hypothetical protein LW807_02710 [Proteobacteria bacterium]|jgi:ADP-heptose:LPS heptosyltransferase|nr:hypothetical protein [Pseudomonadota bacterium]